MIKSVHRPGVVIYQALKMGWPNGVYCFPNSLIGLIVTAVVLAPDLAGCRQPWKYARP
jgi:hypothetical protein